MTSCPPVSVDIERDKLGNAAPHELRPGDLCPRCGEERLDYDGTLNLACPRCGAIQGGSFS
jgi:hypothetical protein